MRDFIEQDVAADPSGAASGWGERRAAFDGGKRKCEMRNENDGADGPCGQVIVQDVEIWGAVGEDGALHLRIGRVENLRAKRFGLALQLERRIAPRTGVIERRGSVRSDVKPRRIAYRTEKIGCAPRFGANAGAL